MVKNFTGSIWSEDEEENPGMHKNYKVYVPYCTSDIYSGRKDADEVSAGFAFHGKFVVEAVVDDLLSNALSDVDISQFVLMGMSAGIVEPRYLTLKDFQGLLELETIATQWQNECERGFQRRTCVASWTDSTSTRSSSLLKVATLLTFHGDEDDCDGVLIELSVEGCDPVDIGAAAAIFWQAEVEQSCQEENGVGSPVCLMFTTYYPYIETPFMLVVPYEDTSMEVL